MQGSARHDWCKIEGQWGYIVDMQVGTPLRTASPRQLRDGVRQWDIKRVFLWYLIIQQRQSLKPGAAKSTWHLKNFMQWQTHKRTSWWPLYQVFVWMNLACSRHHIKVANNSPLSRPTIKTKNYLVQYIKLTKLGCENSNICIKYTHIFDLRM